jgi:uncharacterized protein
MGNPLPKQRLWALFFGLTLFLLSAQILPALEVPPLKGRVNDYARILSPATANQLEAVLQRFETEESTQIVLLTVPSLEGDSLELFSLRVVEAWKLGQAKLDNGALLLVAKNDRKLRIEVGYGLEGKLTDLTSGRIIRNIITPRFKEGNYDQGVVNGLAAMMAEVKGEFSPSAEGGIPGNTQRIDPGSILVFLLIFFLFLGRALARVPWVAAGAGSFIAPLFGVGALGLGGLWIVGLAVLGFIGGLIAASMAAAMGGGHTRGGHWGGVGGFGGGFSGGFGGGGGFSGGGGGFGGGGSSGGW